MPREEKKELPIVSIWGEKNSNKKLHTKCQMLQNSDM